MFKMFQDGNRSNPASRRSPCQVAAGASRPGALRRGVRAVRPRLRGVPACGLGPQLALQVEDGRQVQHLRARAGAKRETDGTGSTCAARGRAHRRMPASMVFVRACFRGGWSHTDIKGTLLKAARAGLRARHGDHTVVTHSCRNAVCMAARCSRRGVP